MTLFFEKQASGYRVKKKILLEKGRKYLFVGTIIRSGICSREYSPEVDLDGNISGWYRKFHEKTSYCRLFDRALTEIKQPWMFKSTRRTRVENGVRISVELNELIDDSEMNQISQKLMELNSVQNRTREIREFQEYARKMITDLSSFVKGEVVGRYSPGS
jgi:hypothetical protein